MSKRLIVVLAVIWMIVLTAGVTSSLTLSMCGVQVGNSQADTEADRVLVSRSQYEMIERYERLQEVLEIVNTYYYKEVEEDTLITGALRGMLDSLGDPYTFYYTPEEMAATFEHQEGTYEGVGVQILGNADGEIVVTRAFKGSSALEEGIRAGDRIVAVEGIPVSAETVQAMNDAVVIIKGEIGTRVTVTVVRGDEMMDFSLERRKINMNRVEYRMLDGEIGYIMLYEFMGDDVDGFREAINRLTRQGAKGLIVDVRSNSGGLLDDVVAICDLLLPKGKIVYIEDRWGERETYYSNDNMLGLPLVVLVNGLSASASEILAGAVQDTGVGTVIGETTFGKGIVQMMMPFESDGAGLQLTTSTYYTPNGRSIHGSGVTPDIVVDNGEFDFTTTEPDPEADAQLKKAVEVIREAID